MKKNSKNKMKKYYPYLIGVGVITLVLTVLGSTLGSNLAGYLNLSKLNTSSAPVNSIPTVNKQNLKPLAKRNVTRAEVANILVHQVLKVNPGTTYTNNPCATDLANVYVNEICYLKDRGIMNLIDGDSTGKAVFHPNDLVNRAEGAKFMATALKLSDKYEVSDIACYADVPAGSWFHKYVCLLLQANISDVEITTSTYFKPADYLTNFELNTWISKAKTANLIQ